MARRWIFALLLLSIAAFAVSESDAAPEADETAEVETISNAAVDPFATAEPAPGIETVYYFPKNPQRQFPAGASAEVLVGINNNGNSVVMVKSIRASVHLQYDHSYLLQNLSSLEFTDTTVPPGVQGTLAYAFDVSKYFQPGAYALVGSVLYEIDGDSYKTVFYNGTMEVVEPSGFFSGETLFLVTLALGLLGLLGMWLHGRFQKLSKTRRTRPVETGTRSTDAIDNEWLQGTAFMQKTKEKVKSLKKKK